MSSKRRSKKSGRKELRAEKKRQAARRKNLFLVLGVGIVLFAGYFFATSGGGPKAPITEGLSEDEIAALPTDPVVGARAPDFTVVDVEDNSFTLSNVLGKPTALMFFHSW
ncbi:MAG: hypothetical protein IIC78_09690 [Chloroflexi bacterium]|nr:hypothetical protein [Chloroflexota bacterium]